MTTGKKVKEYLKKGEFSPAKKRISLSQGEMLKILRKKNELSQNALAEMTGLKQSTISSIENGTISLGLERAKTLAKALRVHPAVLAFPDWEMDKEVA